MAEAKQTKLLAGKPGFGLFQCMVDKIVQHVRERYTPPAEASSNPIFSLAMEKAGVQHLSGGYLLQECYAEQRAKEAVAALEEVPEGHAVTPHAQVAVTFRDTSAALLGQWRGLMGTHITTGTPDFTDGQPRMLGCEDFVDEIGPGRAFQLRSAALLSDGSYYRYTRCMV